MNDGDGSLVTIYSTKNNAIVGVVKSLLDNAGIEYAVEGETLLGIIPYLGSTKFRVRGEDEERARAVVSDIRG